MKKLLRVVGTLSLLAFLLWRVDLGSLGATIRATRWHWWAAAFLCYLSAQLVSGRRWQILARPLGFRQTWGQFCSLYFVGNFFNLVLPTSVGGDVVRAWYLDAGQGRRWQALLTVLADRLSGLYVLLVLAFVASFGVALPAWIQPMAWGSGGLALLGIALFWWVPVTNADGSGGKWRQFLQVVRVYRHDRHLLLEATALALIVQWANVVVVWLLSQAVGLSVSLAMFTVLVPLVTLLTLLPISLNGMGVREGSMVLFLAPLSVSTASAMTLGLLWFTVFVAAGGVGAGCYLFGRFPWYKAGCHDQSDPERVRRHPDQGRAGQSPLAA